MKKKTSLTLSAVILAGFLSMSALGCGGNGQSEGLKSEHKVQQEIEDNYSKGQPVPALTNSQVRENLIEIEEAVAEGVSTTTFFFNQGIADPVKQCPSIGVPIPASSELTNPEQIINPPGDISAANLPQMDPTGIYKGDTTGTYVLCVNAQGEAYVSYWEGFVESDFATSRWNRDTNEIEQVGAASWEFSKHTPPSGTRNRP